MSRPTPDDESNPDKQLPKVRTLDRYNWVIITLEAQLGMSPMILVIIGIKNLLPWIRFINLVSSIIEFNKRLTIKIKKVIFIVWIKLDLIIPSSQ